MEIRGRRIFLNVTKQSCPRGNRHQRASLYYKQIVKILYTYRSILSTQFNIMTLPTQSFCSPYTTQRISTKKLATVFLNSNSKSFNNYFLMNFITKFNKMICRIRTTVALFRYLLDALHKSIYYDFYFKSQRNDLQYQHGIHLHVFDTYQML